MASGTTPNLERLAELLQAGSLRVHVHETYGLEQGRRSAASAREHPYAGKAGYRDRLIGRRPTRRPRAELACQRDSGSLASVLLPKALARPRHGRAQRVHQGKSWAKVLLADRRSENEKAPFPGLFE
jgi:hypothetical protein